MPEQIIRKVKPNELLIRSMLAQGPWRSILRHGKQGLPLSVDDAERDFGLNIYDRMANDPAVKAAIDQIRGATLSDGYRVVPSHRPPSRFQELKGGVADDGEYKQSREIQEFIEQQLDRCSPSFEEVLENLVDAVLYGHKLAEIVLEPVDQKLQLQLLMPRPKQMYAFVADEFMRIYGVYPLSGGSAPSLINESDILPLEKFLIFSIAPRDGDMRGRSQLRSAYTPWVIKQGLWPGYDRFLDKFATPSVVGVLGPEVKQLDGGGLDIADDADLVGATPEEAFLAKLIEFANATAVVVDNGAEVNVIEPKTSGEAHAMAFDLCDRQIQLGILSTTRATLEAKHGSRADSDTAENTVMRIGRRMRRRLEESVKKQVFRRIVAINFGEEKAKLFTPSLGLSANPKVEDQVELFKATTQAWRDNYLHISQKEEMDERLGLPEADIEAMVEEDARRQEAAERSQRLIGSLSDEVDQEP